MAGQIAPLSCRVPVRDRAGLALVARCERILRGGRNSGRIAAQSRLTLTLKSWFFGFRTCRSYASEI